MWCNFLIWKSYLICEKFILYSITLRMNFNVQLMMICSISSDLRSSIDFSLCYILQLNSKSFCHHIHRIHKCLFYRLLRRVRVFYFSWRWHVSNCFWRNRIWNFTKNIPFKILTITSRKGQKIKLKLTNFSTVFNVFSPSYPPVTKILLLTTTAIELLRFSIIGSKCFNSFVKRSIE